MSPEEDPDSQGTPVATDADAGERGVSTASLFPIASLVGSQGGHPAPSSFPRTGFTSFNAAAFQAKRQEDEALAKAQRGTVVTSGRACNMHCGCVIKG